MTVSFVIPHSNRRELLESALDSIARLRRPAGVRVEVIVVDNGSRDGSADAAQARGARVLSFPARLGVSRALNVGIQAAEGEWIALLNNDVEPAEDWLERLLDAAQQTGAWFATGKTLNLARPEEIDGAGDAVCRGGAAWRLGSGRPDSPLFGRRRRTFFPSATAALFRREFFDRVGLFEEAFFAYLEDVDLGLRAGLAELPGLYVPEAAAYHRGSATVGGWSPAMVEWMTSHQLLLLAKHYPARLLWRYARPIVAAQLLWAALAISRGRGIAWLRGLGAALRRAPSIRGGSAALRASALRLPQVLAEAEGEIFRFQRDTGWDGFWKWYFLLAPPAQEAA